MKQAVTLLDSVIVEWAVPDKTVMDRLELGRKKVEELGIPLILQAREGQEVDIMFFPRGLFKLQVIQP